MESEPRQSILSAVQTSMEAGEDRWLVGETGANIIGVTHAMHLPVPPIYAGDFGVPGLLMEDCCISVDAPPSTRTDLLKAAEADLVQSGTRMVLGTSVVGGDWAEDYAQQGYEPVTLYFSRAGLRDATSSSDVRQADASDVADIVSASAVNRQILQHLNPRFWRPHPEADDRFGRWMQHSLTLSDRDMFVSLGDGEFRGYAISQPATRLHFPSPHDISSTGVIDDYFHQTIANPEGPSPRWADGHALLEAAEMARQKRGNSAVLVVCPAAWRTKIALLEEAGYRKAITWFVKIFT
ncbi:hypothetical protein VW35_00455 [Devosia soli]|uniref:N-acetyltransferase domain-containing protein n=1 Tax=Devosia soli TaxID=361041 RepID=A0A0F5LJM1_9HYPH|nr:hypothetical protein [Devosia soli]KKB82586.1 hypothetical protein VW35_00455 [Devosia soli]